MSDCHSYHHHDDGVWNEVRIIMTADGNLNDKRHPIMKH